jgi:hypothetical protein
MIFGLIIRSETVLLLHEFNLAFITRQAYNSFLYGNLGNVDLSASPYLAMYNPATNNAFAIP